MLLLAPHQSRLNSDAAVRFLQRGRVVDTVAGHANHVTSFLQNFHNVKLVFGENLSETVRLLD